MAPRKPKKWVRTRNSHLATTYPKQSRCGACGQVVLAGYDIGIFTLFDPFLLSQIGEAEALIRGLRTYVADYPNFDRRTAWTITANPAPRFGFIIRSHKCGTPHPIPKCIKDIKARAELPEHPDF